jgi:hypothetical protein
MDIYKWKWMVLGALGCINNADIRKVMTYEGKYGLANNRCDPGDKRP